MVLSADPRRSDDVFARLRAASQTRDKITINTFMLERSPYMVRFVNDLMRINGGRVFVATPDRLGEYTLVDDVANKKKSIG